MLGVAVLVTGLFASLIVLIVVLHKSGKPNENPIRNWFASTAGGSAPSSVVRRISLVGCSFTPDQHHGHFVYNCSLTVGSQWIYACFTITRGEHAEGGFQVDD